MYEDLIAKAEREHCLTCEEIVALLENDDSEAELAAAADRVRQLYVGTAVHLRGLIEFSNICSRTCCYCGLRAANNKLDRYHLSVDDILLAANSACQLGYKTIVLQSGEDSCYDMAKMMAIISGIKALGVAVTLSIGEKSTAEYQAYRTAGADRYLLRIETTDENLYAKLHPGMSFRNRCRCLEDLRSAGYEVGTGCIVGLPGQSLISLARDILFFKAIDADMVGIGPFIPHPDTPLRDAAGGTFAVSRRAVALTRLLMPDINLPATTAMEALQVGGRQLVLQSGANVVMPNVNAAVYRKLYALYPGKICMDESPADCHDCIAGQIAAIGRTIGQDSGFRHKSVNIIAGKEW